MTWIDDAHERDPLRVASALGLEVREARGANGGAFGPCPSCKAKRRHPNHKDRRLACGVRQDGNGWRCFECDASGDQVDLVAFVREGERFAKLDQEAKRRVSEWFGVDRPVRDRAPASSPSRSHQSSPGTEPARNVLDASELADVWS